LSFAASGRDTPNYFDDDSSNSEEEEKSDDDRESNATEDGPHEDSGFNFSYSHTTISPDKFPLLYNFFGDKESIDSGRINALIWELLALPMGKDRGVQFDFANESKGCLVNVPSHATEKSFLSTAGRTKSKWIDIILKQVHHDSPDEAVQWLCTYIGKQHEDAFKTAATQLVFPSVVRMDAYDVIAMFDDANATLSRQRTIKQYLR
jgi:hypothetical protein